MRMLRNRRRQGAAQWLKGADRTRSPPGRRQAQKRQGKQGDGGGKGKGEKEGRRKEGPGRRGESGSREETERRAGTPGPEGEGAALSPESALAVPGRGPGAQVYPLGRPSRHARGQALSPVPGGPSQARTDLGSIGGGGHWPGQVSQAPSPSALLAAAFVQARPAPRVALRCAGALLEA